ncbi:MAG: SRPBCC family protein [Gemmatimonadetes bacterium]|nr:SRPBCC family protein [Gemmatimonadota bacterium]
MIPDCIEREIHIAASMERVWSALTEAKHLGTWFGDAGATIDLRPGGEITLEWEKNGTVRGRVERVEPPTVFSFRWIRGGHDEPEPGNHTLVEFTLRPDGGGTVLRMVESGIRALEMAEAGMREYVRSHEAGWSFELGELRDYVERGSE